MLGRHCCCLHRFDRVDETIRLLGCFEVVTVVVLIEHAEEQEIAVSWFQVRSCIVICFVHS